MLRCNIAKGNGQQPFAVLLRCVIDMATRLANAVQAWFVVEGHFLGGAT
jgi:hypothetical protein